MNLISSSLLNTITYSRYSLTKIGKRERAFNSSNEQTYDARLADRWLPSPFVLLLYKGKHQEKSHNNHNIYHAGRGT